jgi:hypothetical protein
VRQQFTELARQWRALARQRDLRYPHGLDEPHWIKTSLDMSAAQADGARAARRPARNASTGALALVSFPRRLVLSRFTAENRRPLPTMMWSCTAIPSGRATSMDASGPKG